MAFLRSVLIALAVLAAVGCPLAQAVHEAGHWAEHEVAYEQLLAHGTGISAPAAPDADEGHCPICQAFAAICTVADLPTLVAPPAIGAVSAPLTVTTHRTSWSISRIYQPPARGPPILGPA